MDVGVEQRARGQPLAVRGKHQVAEQPPSRPRTWSSLPVRLFQRWTGFSSPPVARSLPSREKPTVLKCSGSRASSFPVAASQTHTGSLA
jgi:hypothetical protein